MITKLQNQDKKEEVKRRISRENNGDSRRNLNIVFELIH